MTGTGAIRLLLADVDGTLVTQDKVLTDRARRGGRRLRDAGIASRSPAAARPAAWRC